MFKIMKIFRFAEHNSTYLNGERLKIDYLWPYKRVVMIPVLKNYLRFLQFAGYLYP